MKYTIEQLKDAVASSTKMNQVCKKLQISSSSGANYKKLRELCQLHNISLEHFDTGTFRNDTTKKKCSKCKELKNKTEFWESTYSRDGLQAYCKVCGKQTTYKHYKENKDRLTRLNKKSRLQRVLLKRNFVISLLQENCCVECSESDIRVLDFDHIDKTTKLRGISQMIWDNTPLWKLKEEIEKCEVRCSNCHRKRTFEQFNWYKNSLI